MTREQLELQVQELMTLMDPSYLTARTDVAETMRRLLFAAGVAIAASSGRVEAAAVEALERLLGPGSIPRELKAEVIVADLPRRVEAVRADVPVLRRAQVLRDLCVIARADGAVDGPEIEIIRDLATQLDVDVQALECVFTPAAGECAVAPACPG
jgi:tellurite resistance protein